MAVIDNDVVRRLAAGAPLDDVALPRFEGRVDLRGARFDDLVVGLNGPGAWTGIDFSGATFTELMIRNLSMDNCLFDKARLDSMRMWGTQVKNTSFVEASLREAALGTAGDLGINTFENVDFSRAKMGHSVWFVAKVDGCKFDGLKGVQFEGTQFSNCTFAGTLSDISFQKTTNLVDAARFGSNEMRNVDFSNAKFSWVEFRDLDLDEVTWPVDDDHLVVDEYRQSLERSIAWLHARGDEGAERLAGWLERQLSFAGAGQQRGVLRWSALAKLAGGPIDELRAQLLAR
ncbi:MAG: pentapeptide repeat-containing protein [Polyangiaceae bacterium]|nr:pentapeptide repeat-containing protein [Polyangiaceae bacterium]